MVIELKWDGILYDVASFDVSLASAGATQLAECIPGTIRVAVEVPPTYAPGQKFFNFARTQHSEAKTKGKGQISVFQGHDRKKKGQAIQTVKFEKAWLSNLDTSVSELDDNFYFSLMFIATEVTISDEKFTHAAREKLFVE